jgi:small subunit ribosomal protein S4
MARYRGPRTKIARKLGEPVFGVDKNFEKKNYPPGHHGLINAEKNFLNMVFSLRKNKKQNILMEF